MSLQKDEITELGNALASLCVPGFVADHIPVIVELAYKAGRIDGRLETLDKQLARFVNNEVNGDNHNATTPTA